MLFLTAQPPDRPIARLAAFTAVVLRGGQGIGKGHFAHIMLGALFHEQQYLHIIGAGMLTGRFNEHLSGKALVFADGAQEALARAPKLALAEAIWDRLVPRLPGGERPVRRPRTARRQAVSFPPALRGRR